MQNADCRLKNSEPRIDLSARLLDFAANSISITTKFRASNQQHYIGQQLMRAACSSGANYEEARGAESKADFIHKMQLVHKELKESVFWLKLAGRLAMAQDVDTQRLLNEAEQLVKIISSSILTAKGSKD
jgi:four helix bundle protein